MFAVFIERGCTNHMQLAARKRWFQDIGCVHGTLGSSRTDKQVQLVNKDDDVTLFFDFGNNFFEAIFELTSIFRAGNHTSHIKLNDAFVEQVVRDILGDNALCQPLYDCRLTDTGLTNQYGIVFCASAENGDKSFYFFGTTDHGIKLACECTCCQINSKGCKSTAPNWFDAIFCCRFLTYPWHFRKMSLQAIDQFIDVYFHIAKQDCCPCVILFEQTIENMLSSEVIMVMILGNLPAHFERQQRRLG